MGKNCKHIRVVALGLLTLFAAYYTTIALYAHIHVVDGTMIVHSHPFHASHNHSNSQALSLHFISTIDTLETEGTLYVQPYQRLLGLLLSAPDTQHVATSQATCIHLRAPPACFFI